MIIRSLLSISYSFQINALRVAVNRLICEGPCGALHLGSDRISILQEDCRERITRSHTYIHRSLWLGLIFSKCIQLLTCTSFVLCRLFMKTRENVSPVYYEKRGKWNQVWYSSVLLQMLIGFFIWSLSLAHFGFVFENMYRTCRWILLSGWTLRSLELERPKVFSSSYIQPFYSTVKDTLILFKGKKKMVALMLNFQSRWILIYLLRSLMFSV